MNHGVGRHRHDGRNEKSVEPLHDMGYGQGGARVTFGSRQGPGYGVFKGFKHKIAASMGKDELLWKESPVLQGDARKALRHRTQIDAVRHPNEDARTSTTSDPVRFFGASNLPDGIASQGRSSASQSPHRIRPQGPRAAPTDRLKFKPDDRNFQEIRHSEELSPSQTSADPLENAQATSPLLTEIRRSDPTTSSYRGSRGMDCDPSRWINKENGSTAGHTRPRESTNKSRLHQSSQSDKYPDCTKKQDGIKIVENTTVAATVEADEAAEAAEADEAEEADEADAATDHVPTTDLMRTKSVLRLLEFLRTVVSSADRKLQKLSVLSDFGIWQRVMEMILHVFLTLHHASPALHVLRSTNARPSEYGKALRDFCRAIIYLLVLLSLLQLVAHAVRIVFMVLAALVLPFKLTWFVLKWVASA